MHTQLNITKLNPVACKLLKDKNSRRLNGGIQLSDKQLLNCKTTQYKLSNVKLKGFKKNF